MPETPLSKKLLVKPGQRLAVLNAPAGYAELLGPLPAGAELADPAEGGLDSVHVFVTSQSELANLAPVALEAVKPGGLIWFAYPKRSSKVATDLTRDVGWEPLRERGYEGVALVSVDEVWSAMRFRPSSQVGSKRG